MTDTQTLRILLKEIDDAQKALVNFKTEHSTIIALYEEKMEKISELKDQIKPFIKEGKYSIESEEFKIEYSIANVLSVAKIKEEYPEIAAVSSISQEKVTFIPKN